MENENEITRFEWGYEENRILCVCRIHGLTHRKIADILNEIFENNRSIKAVEQQLSKLCKDFEWGTDSQRKAYDEMRQRLENDGNFISTLNKLKNEKQSVAIENSAITERLDKVEQLLAEIQSLR